MMAVFKVTHLGSNDEGRLRDDQLPRLQVSGGDQVAAEVRRTTNLGQPFWPCGGRGGGGHDHGGGRGGGAHDDHEGNCFNIRSAKFIAAVTFVNQLMSNPYFISTAWWFVLLPMQFLMFSEEVGMSI